MVLGVLLDLLGQFISTLLEMLGLGSSSTRPAISSGDPSRSLVVHVKYAGKMVMVSLDPSWTVAQVKKTVAPLIGVDEEEIKIIFAGTELPDDLLLQACDVGQQSYLHAVRVQIKSRKEDEEGTFGSSSSHLEDRVDMDTPMESGSSSRPLPQKPQFVGSPQTRAFSSSRSGDDDDMNFTNGENDNADDITESKEDDNNGNGTTEEDVSDSEASDFFVFCSYCKDLKGGKLRVRCASCLSGAITVDRPPEGWDDVLVAGRIGGRCEEGCLESFAQFYFKCTSHVTTGEDDSSPPLSLVRRNREEVPCLACGDVKPVILVFPCPTNHVTCIDCFKEYALVKLNQRDFIEDPVTGYSLGCPALCENSLITDPHHFKMLGNYQYERFQRFATEEYLLHMGGVFCPQPDCGMGIIPVEEGCDKIACMHGCGYVFCRKCLEGWHLGSCDNKGMVVPSEDCSAVASGSGYRSAGYYVSQDRAAAAQWGDATRRAMRLSTKPCPSCRVPTERAGGCMHMECTKCKFQWCWVCQNKWTRDCMGNHWFG